ncbi:pyruvate kinase [Bacillus sp. USDA818B3_A]|uniref:pyruvate kinase n=1 Tax=Bacillus sp. USDA818B3_A TaxID=2698834 RepID=UPI00136E5D63|nr:pyruvate kinase [Bacillus sp. USDA818B3_A]
MVDLPLNKQDLHQRLQKIYHQITQAGNLVQDYQDLQEDRKKCRDNLVSYLALREQHLLGLSKQLMDQGFADFIQSPVHVIYTLEKILNHIHAIPLSPNKLMVPTPDESRKIIKKRCNDLFGRVTDTNHTTIMVTIDSKILKQPSSIDELLLNGMDVARINCAHDNVEVWQQLVLSLKKTEQKLKIEGKYPKQKSCKIYMDLAGPKVRIGKIPADPIYIIKGDRLRLYLNPGMDGHPSAEGIPAGVPVSLEKAFRNVRQGDSIFIDDGKIHGSAAEVTTDFIEIEILAPAGKQLRIKEGKGLNLPDSLLSLNLPALTEKDLSDLPFVAKYADILGISFVHSPLDLKKLRTELELLNRHDKIETKDAVNHLARILLEGLSFEKFGIMLARGDLAVEVGAENLSFVQDEILTICTSAYTPVIWATGVFENLTKKGIPRRAEIIDADYGTRAACIMLNKGTHVVDALKMLKKLVCSKDDGIHNDQTNFTRQYGVSDIKRKK